MSDPICRARVSADVVDEIALPCEEVNDLLLRLSRSRFLGDEQPDLTTVVRHADLHATNLTVVEVMTESATPASVLATLEDMHLRPSELPYVVRVLMAQDRARRQHLPYLVLRRDLSNGRRVGVAFSHAYDDTFTAVQLSLADDPSRVEMGWSDHGLIICQHIPDDLQKPQ